MRSNINDSALGTMPRSSYRAGPPVSVYVFPLPVCPYANSVALYPLSAASTTSRPTASNTIA